MPSHDEVVTSIKTVYDPEIPVNVYDLGLIYEIDASDDAVEVKMSLTSAGCPSAQQIPLDIQKSISTNCNLDEAKIKVHVVWEPAWTVARVSPEGKKILGIYDDDEEGDGNE